MKYLIYIDKYTYLNIAYQFFVWYYISIVSFSWCHAMISCQFILLVNLLLLEIFSSNENNVEKCVLKNIFIEKKCPKESRSNSYMKSQNYFERKIVNRVRSISPQKTLLESDCRTWRKRDSILSNLNCDCDEICLDKNNNIIFCNFDYLKDFFAKNHEKSNLEWNDLDKRLQIILNNFRSLDGKMLCSYCQKKEKENNYCIVEIDAEGEVVESPKMNFETKREIVLNKIFNLKKCLQNCIFPLPFENDHRGSSWFYYENYSDNE